MIEFNLHTGLANILLTGLYVVLNYGTFRLYRLRGNLIHWILWGAAMFATTYLFVEVGLLVIHEMERYVVVCFSQAFSSLLFVLLALFRLNKGIVHQMNMKRLQDQEAATSKMDGVLPAFGVSIFQILFLWVGTVPPA